MDPDAEEGADATLGLTSIVDGRRRWGSIRRFLSIIRWSYASSIDHLGRVKMDCVEMLTSKSRNEGLGVGRERRAFLGVGGKVEAERTKRFCRAEERTGVHCRGKQRRVE